MATVIEKKNKDGAVNSYKIMVCVGRDDHGKQVWRTKTIKRPDGLTPAKERKEVKRQADAWEQEQKADYEQGHTTQGKDKITFARFVNEHWFPDFVLDGDKTPYTVQFYRYTSGIAVDYFGAKKKLAQIDVEAVKRFVKYLNTKATTAQGKPLGKTTRMHVFTTTRNILEYAKRLSYIEKNPCENLTQKEKPGREHKDVDFLSSEEARAFMKALESEPIFWQAFMNLLLTTGLRRGECAGLQWGDISDDGLTVFIRRNVTIDKNSENKLHIGETKNKKGRVVPLSRRVYNLLMQLKKQEVERYGLTMNNAYIFHRDGNPYLPVYPTEPTRWQRKFVQRHHLRNVSPHDLRHSAASLAIEAGADLKQVQTLLGHSDPSTTMQFYIGLTEQRQREAVDGIERLLNAN